MKSYSANVFISLLTPDQQVQNNFDHFTDLPPNTDESHQELNPRTTTTATTTDKNEKTISNEGEETRETWTHNFDYLITTLGGLIGLGK